MRIKVNSVKALPNYKLELEFSDGTGADLASHINRAPFTKLSDVKLFNDVTTDFGVVIWTDAGLDIATESVYALVHGLKKPDSFNEALSMMKTKIVMV